MPKFITERTEADHEIEHLRAKLRTAHALLRASLEILDSARVTSLGMQGTRQVVRGIKDVLKEGKKR